MRETKETKTTFLIRLQNWTNETKLFEWWPPLDLVRKDNLVAEEVSAISVSSPRCFFPFLKYKGPSGSSQKQDELLDEEEGDNGRRLNEDANQRAGY